MSETTITLRNAAVLQHSIKAAIKNHAPKLDIELSIFEPNPLKFIDDVSDTAISNFNIQLSLIKALFEVRSKLCAANEGRVNEVLTEIALAKELLGVYSSLDNTRLRTSNEILLARMAKMRESTDSYCDDSVTTSVLSEEFKKISQLEIKNITKRIKVLQDELLHLDTSKRITLSPESAKVLSDEGIL